MADTTTVLNPGSGGDILDESLVQSASNVAAKRPRVVLGSDLGPLTDPSAIVALLEQLVREARAHTVLFSALMNTTANPLGSEEVYDLAAQLHND